MSRTPWRKSGWRSKAVTGGTHARHSLPQACARAGADGVCGPADGARQTRPAGKRPGRLAPPASALTVAPPPSRHNHATDCRPLATAAVPAKPRRRHRRLCRRSLWLAAHADRLRCRDAGDDAWTARLPDAHFTGFADVPVLMASWAGVAHLDVLAPRLVAEPGTARRHDKDDPLLAGPEFAPLHAHLERFGFRTRCALHCRGRAAVPGRHHPGAPHAGQRGTAAELALLERLGPEVAQTYSACRRMALLRLPATGLQHLEHGARQRRGAYVQTTPSLPADVVRRRRRNVHLEPRRCAPRRGQVWPLPKQGLSLARPADGDGWLLRLEPARLADQLSHASATSRSALRAAPPTPPSPPPWASPRHGAQPPQPRVRQAAGQAPQRLIAALGWLPAPRGLAWCTASCTAGCGSHTAGHSASVLRPLHASSLPAHRLSGSGPRSWSTRPARQAPPSSTPASAAGTPWPLVPLRTPASPTHRRPGRKPSPCPKATARPSGTHGLPGREMEMSVSELCGHGGHRLPLHTAASTTAEGFRNAGANISTGGGVGSGTSSP